MSPQPVLFPEIPITETPPEPEDVEEIPEEEFEETENLDFI